LLKGANATLGDAKAKTFGFVTFLSLCKSNILSKSYVRFSWLKECDVTKYSYCCTRGNAHNFSKRFYELEAVELYFWLTQLLLTDLSVVSEQCQQELCELQRENSFQDQRSHIMAV